LAVLLGSRAKKMSHNVQARQIIRVKSIGMPSTPKAWRKESSTSEL